jgi:crotonobetainyl-CoA:carnitine CoA-transferase CaiB-like acyl-CoA transferase
VIKIEDTGAGDYAAAPVRALVNRNKLGLCLDLKQPAGLAVLQRLVREADVLVEAFGPASWRAWARATRPWPRSTRAWSTSA